MILIDEFFRTDGKRDIPCWTFYIEDDTSNNFCMNEQIIAYMMGWA